MAIGGGDLSGNRFAQTGMGFPQTAGQVGGPVREGGTSVRETREEREQRLRAEERAEQDRLGDPTGLRRGDRPANMERVTKKVTVRRKRVQNGQAAEGSGKTNGGNGAEGARRAGPNRGAVGYQGNTSLLHRSMMGHSSLIQASVSHESKQAQNPNANANNPSQIAHRNKMLFGIGEYIKNDYGFMRVNPDDKAFTYRTAEARQLHQTIGAMIASSSRPAQGERKDSNSTTNTTSRTLTPEATSRGMSTLRRLRAMTEDGKLPDNLPTDYRPFEDVA